MLTLRELQVRDVWIEVERDFKRDWWAGVDIDFDDDIVGFFYFGDD